MTTAQAIMSQPVTISIRHYRSNSEIYVSLPDNEEGGYYGQILLDMENMDCDCEFENEEHSDDCSSREQCGDQFLRDLNDCETLGDVEEAMDNNGVAWNCLW